VKDYRCPQCGRLLFKSDAPAGSVQIACEVCRKVRTLPVAIKPTNVQTTR
jgi:phage FluMu protein Com